MGTKLWYHEPNGEPDLVIVKVDEAGNVHTKSLKKTISDMIYTPNIVSVLDYYLIPVNEIVRNFYGD